MPRTLPPSTDPAPSPRSPLRRLEADFLRPYRGYSSIRQRRSDAFSDYNGLQLYLNKRRGDIRYTVGYTLSKATGLGSGNGDNQKRQEDSERIISALPNDRRQVIDHPAEAGFARFEIMRFNHRRSPSR